MIHAQLNYLIAQQRADEGRRAAERERLAHSNRADRLGPASTGRLARLGGVLRLRRAFVAPKPA